MRDAIVTPEKNCQYFYYATNAAKKCGLKYVETERQRDNLNLIDERIWDVTEDRKQCEKPRLWILQGFDHLLPLEVFVLDTGLVFLDTLDCLCPFLLCQEPSICWGIREQEKEEYCRDQSKCPCDDHKPLPWFESSGVYVQGTVADETRDDLSSSIHEKPVTNTSRLLLPCVKHGADDHETCCDATFTHPKDETNSEEAGKILASSVTAQSDSPYEDIQAHPFTDGKPLQPQVLGKFEGEITEIEYCS